MYCSRRRPKRGAWVGVFDASCEGRSSLGLAEGFEGNNLRTLMAVERNGTYKAYALGPLEKRKSMRQQGESELVGCGPARCWNRAQLLLCCRERKAREKAQSLLVRRQERTAWSWMLLFVERAWRGVQSRQQARDRTGHEAACFCCTGTDYCCCCRSCCIHCTRSPQIAIVAMPPPPSS